MFYLFALLSIFGFALQQALLTRYARRMGIVAVSIGIAALKFV